VKLKLKILKKLLKLIAKIMLLMSAIIDLIKMMKNPMEIMEALSLEKLSLCKPIKKCSIPMKFILLKLIIMEILVQLANMNLKINKIKKLTQFSNNQ
jgi:hypothetical protein